jgi:heat shock protein HtpX
VYEQIAANKRRTFVLIVAAVAFAALIGYAVGTLAGVGEGGGVVGLAIAVAIAGAMSIGSFLWGDRLVLASTRAREVGPADEPRLHNVVEGLAIAAGLPKPRVYVVPEQAPNAYATGRDPEHASIAVTRGLLDSMNRVELEGVIGHEIAHVQDRDMLVGTVVATVVGAGVLLAEFFMRSWWWGGMRGRRGGGRDGGGAAALVLFVIGFVLLVLAPILGQVIRLAVSRNREYLADAQGVMLTRYPPGLISALEKIAAAPAAMRSANNATAHLWLNQPSRVEGTDTSTPLERLFSTHPPIADRIARLREM